MGKLLTYTLFEKPCDLRLVLRAVCLTFSPLNFDADPATESFLTPGGPAGGEC